MDKKEFEALAARLAELAVTVDDAAEILGLSSPGLRSMAAHGRVAHVKLFGTLVFEKKALETWLLEKQSKSEQQLAGLQAKQALIQRAAAAYGISTTEIEAAAKKKPSQAKVRSSQADQVAAMGAALAPQVPAEEGDADGKPLKSRGAKATATSVAAAKAATQKASTVKRKRAG